MKKLTVLLLCICLVLSTTACGTTQENGTEQTQSENTPGYIEDTTISDEPTDTPSGSMGEDNPPDDEDSNILIAYFTWADNTQVEHPDAVDVDATTSASVLAPGNAARIAAWIQQEIGGDLHSIIVEEPYSSDYDECLDRAADEKADDVRPVLTSHVDNMEQYDTVFIGYPNWWYTAPMAIFSFIEEYDLSGNTIVLFCTHGTGGLASSVRDITAALPDNCTIADDVLGVYRPDVSSSEEDVKEWAGGLSY